MAATSESDRAQRIRGRPQAPVSRGSAAPPEADPVRRLEAMRAEASRHYQSDASAAREIALRAVAFARTCHDPMATGWAQRILAEASLFSGRMREADAAYAAAAGAWRAAGAGALLGQLLVGRIHVLALLGRMPDVEAAAEEARALLATAGDRVYLAKLAMNLGNLHFQRDEYAAALSEYERAAMLFRRLRLRDQTVFGLEVNRGVALTQCDRDADALAVFHKLEADCGRRRLDLLQAQVRMNRAYVHSLRADFDLALRDLAEATEYFRRTDHPAFLASCLLNHSEIYHQLNLHTDASALAEEAATLFRAEEMGYDQALALFQVALSRLAAGELVSLPELHRAGRLFHQEENPARVALTRLVWGEVLARRGRRREAAMKAEQALQAFRRCGLVRWEAAAARLWFDLEGNRLSPRRRIPLLRRILSRLPDRIYPLQTHRLLEVLGRAQEDAGQSAQAAATYARAVARFESVRTRVPTEDSKIAFLGDKTHLYDRLLRLELKRSGPRPARLFSWMERARAQSLRDRGRDPHRWDGASKGSSRGPESSVRRRIAWLHARVSRLELGTRQERERAVELRAELVRAEREWAQGLRRHGEADTSRSAAEPHGAVEEFPPGALARALPRGWGFLSYHLGDGVSLALAVTPRGALWRELAPDLADRIGSLADRLDFQWAAAAASSAHRSSTALPLRHPEGGLNRFLHSATESILRELYKLLWRPLAEAGLPENLNWIVSPHGAIHRLPLPALLGPQGYLAEDGDFSIVPSARAWRGLPAPRRKPGRRAWIAGMATPGLPAVRSEVERLPRRLTEWKVVQDFAPTRGALRAAGARSDLIHLAAHGSLRTDNPFYSSLSLADGPLFVYDLREFQLSGSTVVLTACSSGRGAAPAGDEWIGLARGFLQAGASTVVASLWPIEDAATVDLMDLFYRKFAAGAGAARSLGQAVRDMMVKYPHPWHWASFAVLGGVDGWTGGSTAGLAAPSEKEVRTP